MKTVGRPAATAGENAVAQGALPPHRRKAAQHRETLWATSLHVFVIVGFAVAQPLYDLLARQAEFFIFQNLARVDILALVVILSVLLPLGLVGVEGLIGLVSQRLRRWVHHTILALGVALTILPALHPVDAVQGIFLVYGALMLGTYTALFYAFFRPVRLFFSLLSPAVLVFPCLFVFASPVFRIIFSEDASLPVERVRIANPPPIVFIILDELPLISLLNEHRRIDAARYPNFAALAQNATWFRNATTVSNTTYHAVPAILTGNYPKPDRLPHAIDHPHNLFTLLAGTYNLNASGPLTQLCPAHLCPQVQGGWHRLPSVLSDLAVVYLHLLLPPDLRVGLPSIAHKWNGFAGTSGPRDPNAAQLKHVRRWARQGFSDRRRQGLDFVRTIQITERPSLYFLHILLPYYPYQYLPSAKGYSHERGMPGLSGTNLSDRRHAPDTWNVLQLYQRHLLQVGFVDTWLGGLLDHLRAIGLYDKALLVLTADHGVSSRPGDLYRQPTRTTFQDIMSVPLFIKAPFQAHGRIDDRPTETVDILPSLADMLDIDVPWAVDGRSAFGPPTERAPRISRYPDHQPVVFTGLAEALERAVARQHRLFGSGPFFPGLFRLGPHSTLIGKWTDELGSVGEALVRIMIDRPDSFTDVDLQSDFIPAHVTGQVTPPILEGQPLSLAVAVNGTIQAVTQPWNVPINGRHGSWSAVVPESSFQTGRNTVEVFVVFDTAGQATLARATGARSLRSETDAVVRGR